MSRSRKSARNSAPGPTRSGKGRDPRRGRGPKKGSGGRPPHQSSRSRSIAPAFRCARHYAATAILRRTGDLELVRRVLRHSTLAMALRYATLTQTEIAAKFERASPLDHLGVGGSAALVGRGPK